MQLVKRCSKCGISKSPEFFYKTIDSWCKFCHNEYSKQKREKQNAGKNEEKQAKILARISDFLLNGKACKKCRIVKASNDFFKRSECIDGHEGVCKQCNKEKDRLVHKKMYEKNKDQIKEKVKQYTEKNRETVNQKANAKKAVMRAEITPLYVKHLLKIKAKDVTDEMIKLKTEQIAIKRLSRQIKHVLKDEKNETSANTH
jgi:hypothetical protein